jgi:DNA-binding NarL/FixJ family response regulator
VSPVDLDKAERSRFLAAFGQNLRTLRNEAGLSQASLAALCFLRHYEVSAIERGQRTPNLVVLMLLADALGSPIEKLTDGLMAPHRAASTKRILAEIVAAPGMRSSELRSSVRATASLHIDAIVRRLAAMGTIRQANGGWEAAANEARAQALTRTTSRSTEEMPLTTREQEVFALVGSSHSDAQIALELGISVRTVQTHVARILRKRRVSDRRHLRNSSPRERHAMCDK